MEPTKIWVVHQYDGPLIAFGNEDEARLLAERLFPTIDPETGGMNADNHVMAIFYYGDGDADA